MAGSKKKKVKRREQPKNKYISRDENPDSYYSETPAWSFKNADQDKWAFTEENVGDSFWSEILPKMSSFESKTWQEILVTNKKQNHSLPLGQLNKVAQKRLESRYIEAEALISLRLSGKCRLYGYMTGRVFNILWYDNDHGDNDTCVCRSRKKHT